MKLYRKREELKCATVSHLKSAYKLLSEPKAEPEPAKKKPTGDLILYDEDTTCMLVPKEIQERCKRAILHPIRMDNFLAKYRGDVDISCTDIFDIIADRDRLSVTDYLKYLPLEIAAIKEDKASYCRYEIEDAREDGRELTRVEIEAIENRAKEHEENRNRIEKKIQKILNRAKYVMLRKD